MTIRGIADAMAVPPMSLYACFSSKSQLLDYMYAEVAGRLFAGADIGDWREGLRSVGQAVRSQLREHPNWAPLLTRPAAPLVSPARERLLESMRAGGMSPEQAFAALSSVLLGSLGLILVELALKKGDSDAALEQRLESLKAAIANEPEQQVTLEALQRPEHFTLAAVHDHSLAMLISGLESASTAPRAK